MALYSLHHLTYGFLFLCGFIVIITQLSFKIYNSEDNANFVSTHQPWEHRNYQEHHRFSELLRTWAKNKPKAAVYYLISNRYTAIQKSVIALHKFFISKYRYPVIIFHDDTCNVSKIDEMFIHLSREMIFFQQIQFKVPDFNIGHVHPDRPCGRKIGYRHMCRFHAKLFSDQLIMKELDYVWRLDDDSFILGKVSYDPFRYMQDNQLLYGYNHLHNYSSKCVVGLWSAVETYVRVKDITMESNSWPEPQEYYNNFEISAMSFWRSKVYTDYFDYIDRLGGIYWHRWGDAPIKSLAVAIFVPEVKRHFFEDIPYRHKYVRLPKRNQ